MRQECALEHICRAVDKHEIKVARKSPMLEAIVEHDKIALRVRVECAKHARMAIRPDRDRDRRQQSAVLLSLIGDIANAAVAAQRNHRMEFRVERHSRNPTRDRALPRASGNDVADGDHGDRQLSDTATCVETMIPRCDGSAIRPCGCASERREPPR